MAFVLCVAGLTACSSIALVPAGEHRLAGGLTVHSAIAWNRPPSRLLKEGSGEVWTGDGLMVDALILISGVENGRPIFHAPSRQVKERKVPVFRSGMLPGELAELIQATFANRLGVTLFEIERLAPYRFAGASGFEMEFQMTMADDVLRRGLAAGAVIDGRLYLVIFEAPDLYYFARYRTEVERLIASARAETSSAGP
ncbi:MAG: hypothetical protein D6757_10965 [Alphaproteobacteria bacterium]|nr:MAG: hypothetical protein D6757_10965 [Alphaproteobacteria bacterium]